MNREPVDAFRAAGVIVMTIVVIFAMVGYGVVKLNEVKQLDDAVKLPLLVIAGLVSLIALLAVMAIAFKTVHLANQTQALGLPDGTVRAVIALSLILIFAVVTVYFFSDLSNGDNVSCQEIADLKKAGGKGQRASSARRYEHDGEQQSCDAESINTRRRDSGHKPYESNERRYDDSRHVGDDVNRYEFARNSRPGRRAPAIAALGVAGFRQAAADHAGHIDHIDYQLLLRVEDGRGSVRETAAAGRRTDGSRTYRCGSDRRQVRRDAKRVHGERSGPPRREWRLLEKQERNGHHG